jgi:hypothetical protein
MQMMVDAARERTFCLPGGLVADGDGCARIAVLRPLSGREEEWLAQHRDTPNALRVTRLLEACLCQLDDAPVSSGTAERLLVADRDYLMLQLRRITLGDSIWAIIDCPACEAKMDVNFQASDVPVQPRLQEKAVYALETVSEGRERTIQFRLPTGEDQEVIATMGTEEAVATLLDRCVLDDGGLSLTDEEAAMLSDAMAEHSPDVDLQLDLNCPECTHAFSTEFDTTAFFLDEMSVRGDQLLREVHTLALFYHWSEAEILGLVRDRRRAYLDLVNESARLN